MNIITAMMRWLKKSKFSPKGKLIKTPKILTFIERLSVCRLYFDYKFKIMDLAKQFDVDESTIRRILKNRMSYEFKARTNAKCGKKDYHFIQKGNT